MKVFFRNIRCLCGKELRSLLADPVMMVLIVYVFSVAILAVANGAKMEVEHAAIAVVDEDHSSLSRQLAASFLPPYFKPAVMIPYGKMDDVLDKGDFVFVLHVPSHFERDVLHRKKPTLQLNVDATAMSQAGNGAGYIQAIILQEMTAFLQKYDVAGVAPVQVVVNTAFNPNQTSLWFTSVMQVINNITILSIILAGAALIREREHGTVEHLLVMPVTPSQIMLAKMLTNTLVILVASTLSISIVIEKMLGIPIAGSLWLYMCGSTLYMCSVTALGIVLATLTSSMAQFGLICIPVMIIMNLLSGSTTPMESMPEALQIIMQIVPSTHYVAFAQAVLYRGATWDMVWTRMVAMVIISAIYFVIALVRFWRAIVDI